MTGREARTIYERVIDDYPDAFRARHRRHCERFAFYLEMVRRHHPGARSIVDVGGGATPFILGCRADGMEATLVDSFFRIEEGGEDPLSAHRRHGVAVRKTDILSDEFLLPERSVDVITCFHVIEHLHHSPKRMLRMLARALREDGILILGVPNCANLHRRWLYLTGRGRWSRIEDWYDKDVFRAHVREPNLGDLRHIVADLGLALERVYGRNYFAFSSGRRIVRWAGRLLDPVIRLRPSWCFELYAVARDSAPMARRGADPPPRVAK